MKYKTCFNSKYMTLLNICEYKQFNLKYMTLFILNK